MAQAVETAWMVWRSSMHVDENEHMRNRVTHGRIQGWERRIVTTERLQASTDDGSGTGGGRNSQ